MFQGIEQRLPSFLTGIDSPLTNSLTATTDGALVMVQVTVNPKSPVARPSGSVWLAVGDVIEMEAFARPASAKKIARAFRTAPSFGGRQLPGWSLALT